MSEVYNGNDVYPTGATLALNGEAKPIESVMVGIKAALDRTKYLLNRSGLVDGNTPIPLHTPSLAFRWTVAQTAGGIVVPIQTDVTDGGNLRLPIPLGPGRKITGWEVIVKGDAGAAHVGFPAALPVVNFYTENISTDSAALVESVADLSPNLPAYQPNHTIEDGGSLVATWSATTRHYLEIVGESGANSVNGALGLMAAFVQYEAD